MTTVTIMKCIFWSSGRAYSNPVPAAVSQCDPPDTCVFCLTNLHAVHKTVVQVFFRPSQCIQYNACTELSSRLLDETAALPILTLELTGGGRSPAILFSAPFLVMPAVPLGIVSSAQFTVVNDGYDNVDFSCRLPADEQHLPLQLEFPQGSVIGMAKPSVPVVVSFCADRPTSFTCEIEILDENGASLGKVLFLEKVMCSGYQCVSFLAAGSRYVLPVSGCSDCFTGTLQPFISRNRWRPQRTVDGINASPDHDWALPDDSRILEIALPKLPKLATKFIMSKTQKDLNEDLLTTIISSHGKALIDVIEALSGGLVTGKLSCFSLDPVQSSRQIRSHYTAILTYLQKYGGLVNIVRPEALMDKDVLLVYLAATCSSAKCEKVRRECELW